MVFIPEAAEAVEGERAASGAKYVGKHETKGRASRGMKLPNIHVPDMGHKGHGINGFTIALAFGGAVLLYSGAKGYGISQTIQDLMKGEKPASDPANLTAAKSSSVQTTSKIRPAKIPPLKLNRAQARRTRNLRGQGSWGGTPGYNRRLGKMLAAPYGWAIGDNWTSLLEMWNQESGWDQYAKNASSGAYGIAQALPESKYPHAGTEAGGSSPYAQISWGLQYIKGRYGSPHNAWRNHYWQQGGWY
jgi:hypothetical protein